MRQYRTELEKTEKIEKIICNKCGREIPVQGEFPRRMFWKWRNVGDTIPERITRWIVLTFVKTVMTS